MSHCSPAQIHLVNIPSCIVSFPLRWEGGGMRQRFTAVLLLLVGLPWKTELQKAAEDEEFEVKIQSQHVSLVSLMRSHFLHSTSGKASCCKYLQLSHQQGWNQSGGHGPFLFRKTSCSWQSAKVFSKSWAAASVLDWHIKNRRLCPKAYLFHSAVSTGLKRHISPSSSPHGNGSHLSRRTFPWATLTFSVWCCFFTVIFYTFRRESHRLI